MFAQQPVPGPILPFTYLIPSPDSELKPPTLRLGWRLGPFKLMELARRYFPNTIERCMGPPTAGMFHLEDEVEYSEEAWEEENDNIIETILGPRLVIALCSVLGIPSKYEEMVCVFPLCDSQLNEEYTLIIGSNYLGIPPPEAVAKLGEIVASIAPDVPLMWYLDIYKWKWRRVPPKPKGELRLTGSRCNTDADALP